MCLGYANFSASVRTSQVLAVSIAVVNSHVGALIHLPLLASSLPSHSHIDAHAPGPASPDAFLRGTETVFFISFVKSEYVPLVPSTSDLHNLFMRTLMHFLPSLQVGL